MTSTATATPQPLPAARYNRDAVERFLCAHHRVDAAWQIVPFGRLKECWEVMRSVTLTVEAQIPPETTIRLRDPDPERQAIRCAVGGPRCKMLDSCEPSEKQRFRHPQTKLPMALDFDRVCPYSIVTRHVRSDLPVPLALRINFYHQGINALELTEEHDDLVAIGGGIKGAYAAITHTPPYGRDVEIAALKRREFSYINEFFASTMALVGESNLRNGIVALPPDFCATAAALPVFRGAPALPEDFLEGAMAALSMNTAPNPNNMPEEAKREFEAKWLLKASERKKKPISFFYALPINHVLAWGLHSEDYCRQHGVDREEFWVHPAPVNPVTGKPWPPQQPYPDNILLYYLVPDVTLDALVDNFRARWMGRVDVRPLHQIAFDFVPLTGARRYPGVPPDAQQVTGSASARSTISYMVAPKLTEAQIANLAPALSPTFASCRLWDPVQAERERQLFSSQ